MSKTPLRQIDIERWMFVVYETPDEDWVVDFSYSPRSYIDLSMLIQLTDDEKDKAKIQREFLIELSHQIRAEPNTYFQRALSRDDFLIEDIYNDIG